MESFMLSPVSMNPDLTVLAFPRDRILNQPTRNYLVSTTELICLKKVPDIS